MGRKPAGEYEKRFAAVQRLVVLQMEYGDIAKRISEDFNVSIEQSRLDIKAVYRSMQEASVHERPMRAHNMRRSMQAFYRQALQAKQFKAALAALDRLCRLDGLYAAEKHEVTGPGGKPLGDPFKSLTSAEIREKADEMRLPIEKPADGADGDGATSN